MSPNTNPSPIPVEIKLDKSGTRLRIVYADDKSFEMSSEYLRVHSPSAELKGHGGEGTLQLGKQEVRITSIEAVGNYAIRLIFSDGHDTGLYTWKVLNELGSQREYKWQQYLARVAAAKDAQQ